MAATPPAESAAIATPAPTTAPTPSSSGPPGPSTGTTAAAAAAATPLTALPAQPALSTSDDGLSRRPRDARVLHLILSSLGIHSYQERVPLQLLDFAYRYTSGVLSDSLRLSGEGYAAGPTAGTGKRANADASAGEGAGITVAALRQAIASRMESAFVTALPKEWMLEQAGERNRVMLPRVEKGFGLHLPHERYVLTGNSWGLDVEESEGGSGDEDGEEGGGADGQVVNGTAREEDEVMGGMDEGGEDEDEEGGGTYEDVFGEDQGMKDT